MRAYANRVDANQEEIVAALKKAGATVQLLNRVGDGCPDLLIGFRHLNILAEVKRDLSERLTPDQASWHADWRGQIAIIFTAEDAIEVLRVLTRGRSCRRN